MRRTFLSLLLATLLISPAANATYTLAIPVPPDPAIVKWRTVTFQYAKPGDVLKLMGYGSGSALPDGVAHIVVLPDTGSLRIDANDVGFAKFKESMNTVLKIGPKQVRLKIVVASLPRSQQVDVDLSTPSWALKQVQEAGAAFYVLPSKTVTDGGAASFTVDWAPIEYLSTQKDAFKAVPTLSVGASVADDDSVSLSINFEIPPPPSPFSAKRFYTIPIWSDYYPTPHYSKIMAVYDATGYGTTGSVDFASNHVLVFVTPTVIEPSVNGGEAVTVTP